MVTNILGHRKYLPTSLPAQQENVYFRFSYRIDILMLYSKSTRNILVVLETIGITFSTFGQHI